MSAFPADPSPASAPASSFTPQALAGRGFLVDGEWRTDADRIRIDVVDPATERVTTQVAEATAEDVDDAVRAARRAAPGWAARSPRERDELLNALADALLAHSELLCAVETTNAGHPCRAMPGEIGSAADRLRFFGGAARLLEGRSAGEYVPGYTSILRREPLGVAAMITPWNYPLLTAVTKISPALAAGNTVVLKPSEQTPLTTLALAELAAAVFPAGVLNVVTGRGDTTGAALAGHPGIDIVSLTGSPRSGREVSRLAAKSLAKVHLELGGKAAAVVLADADPDAVASSLRAGSFWNAGQDCSAAARVVVSAPAYDQVVAALVQQVGTLRMGDPHSPHVEMGPLTYAGHRQAVLGFIARAVDDGGTVLLGGGTPSGPGWFVEPTVIADVDQHSEIVQREVFGPVITVQRAADDGTALAMAADIGYGLSTSVFTRDVARALDAARSLRFGTVWVNDHGPVTAEMPWSGLGESGHGAERSVYSLQEYTYLKHVMVKLS